MVYLRVGLLPFGLCFDRENYICCNRDFKFHFHFNKHMFLVHGEHTNVRVKPTEGLLMGQFRAMRVSMPSQTAEVKIASDAIAEKPLLNRGRSSFRNKKNGVPSVARSSLHALPKSNTWLPAMVPVTTLWSISTTATRRISYSCRLVSRRVRESTIHSRRNIKRPLCFTKFSILLSSYITLQGQRDACLICFCFFFIYKTLNVRTMSPHPFTNGSPPVHILGDLEHFNLR